MEIRVSQLLPGVVLAAGLLLSACGGSDLVPGSASVAPAAATSSVTAAEMSLAVVDGLGEVVVGTGGLTLYGFTDDAAGAPTCVDKCLAAWPALLAPAGGFTPPAGFDASLFSVVDRPDGGSQVKFGKWPLYFYAGDGAPGEALGQGIGGKWFVLDETAALIKDPAGVVSESGAVEPPAAAPAAIGSAAVGAFGTVVVDAQGLSVYGFTDDVDGSPTCVAACAKAWPALPADAAGTVPAGLDPALLTVVDRPDGGKQLKYGKWPLYYYAGDGSAGEALGQGVGGKWFLVGTDGKLVKEALTAEAPAVTEAPAAEAPAAPAVEAPAAPAGPVVGLADVGALGSVMVGANGHTLYAFTDDSKTTATCVDACAAAWPPLVVDAGFTISEELVQSGVSTITRADGSLQLVMGDWPLYFYAGDGAPGDALGQGLNGKWFAVSAACKLVKTAA